MKYTVIVRHPDTDEPTALLAGKSVPGWAKGLVHADDLACGSDSGSDDGAKDSKPAKPTKAEMLAEIESRNEGRDEEHKIVPASEKNDDLAEALRADDEASDDDN